MKVLDIEAQCFEVKAGGDDAAFDAFAFAGAVEGEGALDVAASEGALELGADE